MIDSGHYIEVSGIIVAFLVLAFSGLLAIGNRGE